VNVLLYQGHIALSVAGLDLGHLESGGSLAKHDMYCIM